MARTVLANQDLVHTGLIAPTYTAVVSANGFQFLNAGTGKDLILHVKNDGAGTVVVTTSIVAKVENKYEADATSNAITFTTGQEGFIAQFTKSTFNQAGEDTVVGDPNYVFLDFDTEDAITVALIEIVTT